MQLIGIFLILWSFESWQPISDINTILFWWVKKSLHRFYTLYFVSQSNYRWWKISIQRILIVLKINDQLLLKQCHFLSTQHIFHWLWLPPSFIFFFPAFFLMSYFLNFHCFSCWVKVRPKSLIYKAFFKEQKNHLC